MLFEHDPEPEQTNMMLVQTCSTFNMLINMYIYVTFVNLYDTEQMRLTRIIIIMWTHLHLKMLYANMWS